MKRTRANNLQRLINEYEPAPGNRAAFCRRYGLDPLQIGQYFTKGDNGRNLGEKKARQIEKLVGLTHGWLDADSSACNDPMDIGCRLDLAMKCARFATQKALALASGVPQPTIARILKNSGTKGPEAGTLRKLSVACGVSFSWLNGEDHEQITSNAVDGKVCYVGVKKYPKHIQDVVNVMEALDERGQLKIKLLVEDEALLHKKLMSKSNSHPSDVVVQLLVELFKNGDDVQRKQISTVLVEAIEIIDNANKKVG